MGIDTLPHRGYFCSSDLRVDQNLAFMSASDPAEAALALPASLPLTTAPVEVQVALLGGLLLVIFLVWYFRCGRITCAYLQFVTSRLTKVARSPVREASGLPFFTMADGSVVKFDAPRS